MKPTRSAFVFGLAALTASASSLLAVNISVPNGSLESQIAGPPVGVDTRIDSWQKTAQPVWFDPAATGGITWDQLSGMFANPGVGQSGHKDNIDGIQAGYIFALPTVGFFQDNTTTDWNGTPSTFNQTYEAGMSYELTVGVVGGGGGMVEGTTMEISLYYRDGLNAIVPIDSTGITFNTANFPTTGHFMDYSVTVDVGAGDAWAGKNIGILIQSTSGAGQGYWDLDNVRLTSTAVPEPTTMALLGLGLGGMLFARSRRQG